MEFKVFLVLTVFAGPTLGAETWLDFSCHPGYIKAHFDRMMEDYCDKWETNWEKAPRAKCFKACQAHAFDFARLPAADPLPLEVPMDPGHPADTMYYMLSENGYLARKIAGRVTLCYLQNDKELEMINEKSLNCKDWGVLYKCIEEGVKCLPGDMEE